MNRIFTVVNKYVNMDPATLQMIMSAAQGLQGLGQGISAMESAAANKRYDKYLKERTFELKDIFNNQYNQNFLDTKEAKSVIQTLLDRMEEGDEKSKSTGKITGESDEKSLARKDKMNENLTDSLTRLAGMGTRRKEGILNTYMNQRGNLDAMNINKINQDKQQAANLAQNSNQFGQNALMMLATGGTGSKTAGKTGNNIPMLGNAPTLGNAPDVTGYDSYSSFLFNKQRKPQTFIDLINS